MLQHNITLAFVGDVMLGRGIDALAETRAPEAFWGDTLPVLRAADGVIANLECPITRHERAWRRTWKSFRFRAAPSAVGLLEAANIRGVNLANNHILDFEWQGLLETLGHLDAAGIAHAGAGCDSRAAAQPALFEIADRRIGLIGLTDNVAVFAAGPRTAGTNHVRIRPDHATLSLIDLQLRGLRQAGAEVVILSAHWGPNLRTWPPARFKTFARRVVELGVDVFHGHSAHLFQGVEAHAGGIILYDTGDFLDDYWVFPGVRTDRSFVFQVEFTGTRTRRLRVAGLSMVPVSLARTAVHLARGSESHTIRRRMDRCCRALGTPVTWTEHGLQVALGASAAGLHAEPAAPCCALAPAMARQVAVTN
jgi:poly-gamma-glutamate synthesis protein (capsule biosynthesis protein)